MPHRPSPVNIQTSHKHPWCLRWYTGSDFEAIWPIHICFLHKCFYLTRQFVTGLHNYDACKYITVVPHVQTLMYARNRALSHRIVGFYLFDGGKFSSGTWTTCEISAYIQWTRSHRFFEANLQVDPGVKHQIKHHKVTSVLHGHISWDSSAYLNSPLSVLKKCVIGAGKSDLLNFWKLMFKHTCRVRNVYTRYIFEIFYGISALNPVPAGVATQWIW